MTPIEITCVCLGVVCSALAVSTAVLASVVPFLYHRLSKAEDKLDQLDTVLAEVLKAAGMEGDKK